ncbi:hypothetical protein B0H15DRAFT_946556 [Mycena belliarum]|uniref:Uncharacterized protein n=1 Tax=Mycena belliarum TaxID=1033014 RepID=A0AAD6XRV4_9AGAR|nr:hypothetical protein B0H15DRAFT_946556 [Mycena belliae]
MYRTPSPFAPEHQRAQPYGGQITPGSITYTTSTGPDGRVIYHPFKAVAASYQTPTGIVSGIQWVPAEATLVLPHGAQPANSEFAASWSRGAISKDEQKALKEWQRDEEKRRKKEEKEAKRQREKEQRIGQGYGADPDSELRKARERDAQAMATRERRKSFNQAGGAPSPMTFPASSGSGYPATGATGYQSANPGYPSTPYTAGYNGVPAAAQGYEQRDNKYSTGAGLSEQFGDLDLGYGAERERKVSGLSRPSRYQMDAERTRKVSSNLGDRPAYNPAGSYPSGAYPNTYPAQTGNPYPSAPYSNPSPNMRPGDSPHVPYATSAYGNSSYSGAASAMARPTTPYGGQVYPPGHIMEGKPIPGTTPPIPGVGGIPGGYPPGQAQAPFPTGMQMPDANTGDQGQLAAPEGFSRPINAAQAYTPFETMKIQDMEDIQNAPRMPAVLQTHDVYGADWNRMIQVAEIVCWDLCLAWTGRLPAPGRPQRKTTLAADLIDLWNVSFFFPRGVEVVLYKGRERRSGPSAGVVDIQLPTYDDHDDASSSSSSSSEDSDSDSGGRYPAAAYMYGQQAFAPGQGSTNEVLEQRRRRREARAEKKRRRKEKKARRKAKAREKKYALYLACVPVGGPNAAVGGMPSMGMGNVGMIPTMGGMGGPQMGPQMGGHGMGASMGGPGMGMSNTMGGVGYGAVAGGMPMSNPPGAY